MTSIPSSERETLFDLPFATARERMASLRDSARPSHPARRGAASTDGWLRRLRVALGAWLIDLGKALLADGSVRTPIARP